MKDEIKIAVLLGRLLDLMARVPEITDDHRTALQALAELVARRSAVVVFDGTRLMAEGEEVPEATPFARTLRERLAAHHVARLMIGHGATAVDLVEVLRGLAASPPPARPAQELEERLEAAQVASITIVSREREAAAASRRAMRPSEALRATADAGGDSGRQMGVVPSSKGAAFNEMVRQQHAATGTLAASVARLQDPDDPAPLLSRLDAAQNGIAKAIAGNDLNPAFEALLRMVTIEAETADPDIQRQYGIAMRRLLTSEHLKKVAPLVFDDVYHEDVVLVMRRAGKTGTKVLLDLLIDAQSQAERRAYLRALRRLEEGMDVIASLLNHHEWFVVRNAADLVGELRIPEAVPLLTRVAQHDDPRVRQSVGLALARIGTPETALPLRKFITDPDLRVRMAVVKEVGGRNLSGLAMPLVSAAAGTEDPDVLAEYYHALGRIGTPDAVQALVKAATDSGKLLARKAGPRLAAIKGLGMAGGPTAVATLKDLVKSRSSDIRSTAAAALERATASQA